MLKAIGINQSYIGYPKNNQLLETICYFFFVTILKAMVLDNNYR
jgi:hypothetical protein